MITIQVDSRQVIDALQQPHHPSGHRRQRGNRPVRQRVQQDRPCPPVRRHHPAEEWQVPRVYPQGRQGPSLSYRLRRELIERVCQQVNRRVPVPVGVTDTAFVESIQLAQYAADVGANLFPQLYVKLAEAHRLGDFTRAQALQSQIRRVGDALYYIGKHPSSVKKGIKCPLACLGVCNDFMAEPFHRFRAGEREPVKMRLKQLQAGVSELDL